MINKKSKNELRIKRHLRLAVKGNDKRPRLSIYRSNSAIYCQVIDDTKGITLVSASTKELKLAHPNKDAAIKLGELIAKKAINKKIDTIVFDRSGYLYHGRIKALSDAARKAGLKF